MYHIAYKPLVMVHYVCILLSKTHVRLRSGMYPGTCLKTTLLKGIFGNKTAFRMHDFRLPQRSSLEPRVSGSIRQRLVVIYYRRFGTTFRSNLQLEPLGWDRWVAPQLR